MEDILSKRAKTYLQNPVAFLSEKSPNMRSFSGELSQFYVDLEIDSQKVKKLSFFGKCSPLVQVILEALNAISQNRSIQIFDQLSLRELEAFLRDRNSEPAIKSFPEQFEIQLKQFLGWLRIYGVNGVNSKFGPYEFKNPKPFGLLGTVEKIQELKSFFLSDNVRIIYENEVLPEVLDIDDFDIYLEVPYKTEKQKALLHDLQELLVETFNEEKLNLIPEP